MNTSKRKRGSIGRFLSAPISGQLIEFTVPLPLDAYIEWLKVQDSAGNITTGTQGVQYLIEFSEDVDSTSDVGSADSPRVVRFKVAAFMQVHQSLFPKFQGYAKAISTDTTLVSIGENTSLTLHNSVVLVMIVLLALYGLTLVEFAEGRAGNLIGAGSLLGLLVFAFWLLICIATVLDAKNLRKVFGGTLQAAALNKQKSSE